MSRADSILSKAKAEIARHEQDRDERNGDRAMCRAVAAYNTLTGQHLTESGGNLLLMCLKLARITSAGTTEEDSFVDLCGYTALYAEAAATDMVKPSRRVVSKGDTP